MLWVFRVLNLASWAALVLTAICEALLLRLGNYGLIHIIGGISILLSSYNAANTAVMIKQLKAAKEAAKYEPLKKVS